MLTVTGQGHALVDVDFQIQLPALPLIVGTILPVGHGVFRLLLRLGFHNRKAVLQAQLVRRFPKQFQGFLVAVVLFAGIAAHGVDYEMGMDMVSICMGCHNNLEAGNLLRQLESDLVRHLRGDRIVGMEGLYHVVVQPSPVAVVLLFSVHELLKGNRRNAVDTGHQRSAIVIYLGCLAAVIEDTTQTTYGLSAPVLYEVNSSRSFYQAERQLFLHIPASDNTISLRSSSIQSQRTQFSFPRWPLWSGWHGGRSLSPSCPLPVCNPCPTAGPAS